MSTDKVLVLNATGKVGRNVCRALIESGFDVYGTTRSNKTALVSQGIKPVLCNYTVRTDLDGAIEKSGAKKVFAMTDYFAAAKSKASRAKSSGTPSISYNIRPG